MYVLERPKVITGFPRIAMLYNRKGFSDTTLEKPLIFPGDAALGLSETINQLESLLSNKNVNDYIFKPTHHAYERARRFLIEAHAIMGSHYSQPSIVPDGEGGIDIEWVRGGKEVLLCCRASEAQRDYIYYQEGEKYGAHDASVEYLRDRLNWLIQP